MNLNEIYICYEWYARVRISYRKKGSKTRSTRILGIAVLGNNEDYARIDLAKQIRTKGASYKLEELISLEQRRISFAFWLKDPQCRNLDTKEKQELIQFLQTEKLKEDEANQVR